MVVKGNFLEVLEWPNAEAGERVAVGSLADLGAHNH
jgi:hypothetical protein